MVLILPPHFRYGDGEFSLTSLIRTMTNAFSTELELSEVCAMAPDCVVIPFKNCLYLHCIYVVRCVCGCVCVCVYPCMYVYMYMDNYVTCVWMYVNMYAIFAAHFISPHSLPIPWLHPSSHGHILSSPSPPYFHGLIPPPHHHGLIFSPLSR